MLVLKVERLSMDADMKLLMQAWLFVNIQVVRS